MNRDYWHQQSAEPLYPNLLWSRPENKQHAGKLIIIGGNSHSFAAPAEAMQYSLQAGIGSPRVVIPDSVQKILPGPIEGIEFAPSTPVGSFARESMATLLELSSWADGALLAGDFGRNAETAALFEQYFSKYSGPLALTKDSVEFLLQNPESLIQRSETLLIVDFGQFQKIAAAFKSSLAFTSTMGVLKMVDGLHALTNIYPASIITRYQDRYFVASSGQVSTTPDQRTEKIWRLQTASHAVTWWIQNPQKPFEALSTALFALQNQ